MRTWGTGCPCLTQLACCSVCAVEAAAPGLPAGLPDGLSAVVAAPRMTSPRHGRSSRLTAARWRHTSTPQGQQPGAPCMCTSSSLAPPWRSTTTNQPSGLCQLTCAGQPSLLSGNVSPRLFSRACAPTAAAQPAQQQQQQTAAASARCGAHTARRQPHTAGNNTSRGGVDDLDRVDHLLTHCLEHRHDQLLCAHHSNNSSRRQ